MTQNFMKFRPFLIVAFILMSTSVKAEYNQILNSPTPLQLEKISTNTHWHQLLAYDSTTKSAITNSDFFLSANGSYDPLSELNATLFAFQTEISNLDQHAQCRFPARYIWLGRQLDLTALGIKPVICPKYESFSKRNQIDSLSLIFATGYLGNPASYYGHLLLKINSEKESKTSDLESTAINFGANVPANENMVLYILKGIFGGYDSSFTDQQFFYHSHNYGESELRDLWEYQLDISEDDLALLTAHFWELLGADYTYFFFNRNCAYRMGEVLQLVSDQPLVERWRPWETPQAIMQRLHKLTYEGHPIIKEVIYHPSRQSRLYQRYAKLNNKERKHVHELVKHPETLNKEALPDLSLQQQFQVTDTLIDYYQFVRKDKEGVKDINNEYYRRALSQRYALPPGEGSQLFLSNNQPHLGRKPSYLNLGVITRETSGSLLNLWLRPAYYDSLDASYGHIKNASLSMGEINLGITEDSSFIREFNVVKIESLRRNFTGLPGDRHNSWYLEAGAQQEWLDCDKCLVTKLRSGYGYASSFIKDRLLLAGFVGGGFWGQSAAEENIYASFLMTANFTINDQWSARLEAEQRHFNNRDVNLYRGQLRAQIATQMDARLYFAQDREQEAGLSLGFYW